MRGASAIGSDALFNKHEDDYDDYDGGNRGRGESDDVTSVLRDSVRDFFRAI